MSDLYIVELTSAELKLVRIALGRDLAATRKPAPRPKAAARPRRVSLGKPPKLSDKARTELEYRWADAIANPAAWHHNLAASKSRALGYANADAVAAAWGLPPVSTRMIDATIAARS